MKFKKKRNDTNVTNSNAFLYFIYHIYYVQYSKSVHCQYGKISILMKVRIKKCIFSDQNSCGNHGICQEIQKNVLHYATCNCFKGNISNKATFINNFY